MPFKLAISDPETGKAVQYELDDAKTNALIGKQIGDVIDGDVIHGSGKKRVLIRGAPGFRPKRTGIAKRKTVRGRELGSDIAQVNMRIEEKGSTPLEELVMKAV